MNMDHVIRVFSRYKNNEYGSHYKNMEMYTILPQFPHHLLIKTETIERGTEKQKKSELLKFLQCF